MSAAWASVLISAVTALVVVWTAARTAATARKAAVIQATTQQASLDAPASIHVELETMKATLLALIKRFDDANERWSAGISSINGEINRLRLSLMAVEISMKEREHRLDNLEDDVRLLQRRRTDRP